MWLVGIDGKMRDFSSSTMSVFNCKNYNQQIEAISNHIGSLEETVSPSVTENIERV
jgi:hypothetical protein